jgi:hypothetical protein
MEHVMTLKKVTSADVGYHGSDIYPKDCKFRVGKRGIDKSLTLDKIIELAYGMEEKPNIIIKAGPNAKWYLKSFPKDKIQCEIEKQKWRNISRCIMYIVEWDK